MIHLKIIFYNREKGKEKKNEKKKKKKKARYSDAGDAHLFSRCLGSRRIVGKPLPCNKARPHLVLGLDF